MVWPRLSILMKVKLKLVSPPLRESIPGHHSLWAVENVQKESWNLYTSKGGARYLLCFTDDFSRKPFGYFLKSKDEVTAKF